MSEPEKVASAPAPEVKPAPRETILRVRALKKNYPIQKTDASLYARTVGALLKWTGAVDEWSRLNDGLPILKGIDLDVYSGETLAIIGPSGAGKSTLLHLMGALEPPSDGVIMYRDKDLTSMRSRELAEYRNRRVGFVFQFYYLFPDLNALENTYLPALIASSTMGWVAAAGNRYRDRARDLLTRIGLGPRMFHRPSQLSGGEQQRVAIARALLLEPEIVLCDEPTGNLDRKTGESVLEALFELKEKSGQTYILVTHDARLAERADRKVELEDGKLRG
ncbi:ABC transporter ATP-binding protein [bacterium]|nr:ABC transporter ATP-binding protein [bacterium]